MLTGEKVHDHIGQEEDVDEEVKARLPVPRRVPERRPVIANPRK
jgi:hypothetical protein